MFLYLHRGIFLATLGLTLSLYGFKAAAQKNSHAELSIGLYSIRAEIAATPAARTQGLMYRQFLPLYAFSTAASTTLIITGVMSKPVPSPSI